MNKKRNFFDCSTISKCIRVEVSKHKIDNIKSHCQSYTMNKRKFIYIEKKKSIQ